MVAAFAGDSTIRSLMALSSRSRMQKNPATVLVAQVGMGIGQAARAAASLIY
jgi:hypothetical protein